MGKTKIRNNFHQACWDEPIIFDMSTPGVRGILIPDPGQEIKEKVGDVDNIVIKEILRKDYPNLPELSQKQVLMHWLHLSQETMGANLTNEISQGTCTMKYNPRINEELVGNHKFSEVHPLQDEDTVQGILEIYYKFEQIIKEISGMDKVSFQPSGGSLAIYAAACMIRSYFEEREDFHQRNEIITTIYSHPCNAAAPNLAGFKIITLYPGENGLPELDALQECISDRTAALFITNPEDIGLYNPNIDEFVKLVHKAGGLCFYDQANANALLGIARAKEVGFDMCHFNLHKTFASPHGCGGPGNAALCCTQELAKFLPVPTVEFDGEKYYLSDAMPHSIGKIRDFFGSAGVILRAYAWTMMLGAEGLKKAAEISVLNNNYLYKKLVEQVPGLSYCYRDNKSLRQEQVRYTWEKIKEDTGVLTEDIARRVADYGTQVYFTSHHPWVVPEPMTLEPCETYTKKDLDEYIEILKQISKEAYENPELVKSAPHRTSSHKLYDENELNDPEKWAITWRAYQKKNKKQ